MSMNEDEFGRRLRRARAAAGLSRAQVATALAVRRSDVARLEHGRRLVSTVELTRLARLYRKPSARCRWNRPNPSRSSGSVPTTDSTTGT
jgi:transcriptional regulator with XRE-family HTH domain